MVSAARARGCGAGSVVGPGLRCSPAAAGGEVDAEGAGGAVGGQDFGEAVAELRECGGEGMEAGDGSHAGEVEGVAGGVEVAVEDGGVFAAEGEASGSEEKAGEGGGRGLFGGWLLFATGVWRWRGYGLEGYVAGD